MAAENTSSEYKIIKRNSKNLIVCFGGMKSKFGKLLPFEFLNYLSKTYPRNTDMYFFIDKNQGWYHKGIDGITQNIDETVLYLKSILKSTYKKILFMGISAGGYASILFGSLCNISNVIAFIPRTLLKNSRNLEKKYIDLKSIINKQTEYILHGDLNYTDITHNHHISQCTRLDCFPNVKLIYHTKLCMKILRDNGTIKQNIDNILVA